MITARALIIVEAFMKSHCLDYPRAAREVAIDPAVAADPDAEIPLQSFMQLLENVAREWGNDAFGVLLGESYMFGRVGVFDYAIANAPTLEVALTNYVRFLNLVVGGFDTRLERRARMSHLTMNLPPILGPQTQAIDAALTAQVVRIRHIMHEPDFPVSVDLMRRPPRAIDEFKRILGPGIRFRRPQNRIGIATSALGRPLPAADPVLYEVIEAAAEKAMSARRSMADPVSQLATYLSTELPHGEVTLGMAATALGCSSRELIRELRQAGTAYKDVVSATRKSMADHYIKNSDLPLTEIAFLLGFSELSAFSRAAKIWFGEAPREIRKQMRS